MTCFAGIARRLWRRVWNRSAAAALFLVCLAAGMGAVGWLRHEIGRPLNPDPFLTPESSALVLDRDGAMLHGFLNPAEQWCMPVELEAVSPYLADATRAVEDQRFHRHTGVDPWAVCRAVLQNLWHGGVVSGASTLTMQVVKLEQGGGRTIPAKLDQMITALRLERHASKKEILAAYLNKAPYGGNLVGVEAASRRYFGRPSSELRIEEAALLAGLPKSPSRLAPHENPAGARARRNHVLRRMHAEGLLPGGANLAQLQEKPLGIGWHDFPQQAPHVARRVASKGAVRTTLDTQLQARVEFLLPEYLKRYDNQVGNGAVLVVDVPTSEVLVWAGSAGFHRAPAGQVDFAAARRSPGSALKPFTYALAMESQVLYPSEILLDDALDFGAYNPTNFDGTFHGLVSAADALRFSLNIPAIQVLARIGQDSLYGRLRELAFTTLDRPAGHYGLGLTLGNCEVRLDELAAAYAALARGGTHLPLRLLPGAPGPARPVFDAGVSWAVTRALVQPLPTDNAPELARANTFHRAAAWKTGTSAGHRDAWALVYDHKHVVAVWMGNPNGEGSPRLVGETAALPLAGRIFRELPMPKVNGAPSSGHTHEATLCATTGLPAQEWCPAKTRGRLPKSLHLHRRCDVHRPAPLGEGVQTVWPPSPHQWNLAQVPRLRRDSGPAAAEETRTPFAIAFPSHQSEFVLTGLPNGDVIELSVRPNPDLPVHWYLDGKYLGAGAPLRLELEAGEHRLSCMHADTGAMDRVDFSVRDGLDAPPG